MTALERGQKSAGARARAGGEGWPVRRECGGNSSRAGNAAPFLPGKGFMGDVRKTV